MIKGLVWLQAARIISAINIQLPLAFGSGLAYFVNDSGSVGNLLWLFFYGIATQLHIVFLNDWTDRDADSLNEKPTVFSGGSRVLVENKLDPHELRNAGLVFGFLVLIWSTMVAIFMIRPHLPLICVIGLSLFWLYSLPPAKLNYRVGGEILQALGVGAVLPIVAFYLNTGTGIETDIAIVLIGYVFLQFAAAVAFTLPDIEADGKAGKGTFAVYFGVKKARVLSISCSVVGLIILRFCGIPAELIMCTSLPLVLILLSLVVIDTQNNIMFTAAMLMSPAIIFAMLFVLCIFSN